MYGDGSLQMYGGGGPDEKEGAEMADGWWHLSRQQRQVCEGGLDWAGLDWTAGMVAAVDERGGGHVMVIQYSMNMPIFISRTILHIFR